MQIGSQRRKLREVPMAPEAMVVASQVLALDHTTVEDDTGTGRDACRKLLSAMSPFDPRVLPSYLHDEENQWILEAARKAMVILWPFKNVLTWFEHGLWIGPEALAMAWERQARVVLKMASNGAMHKHDERRLIEDFVQQTRILNRSWGRRMFSAPHLTKRAELVMAIQLGLAAHTGKRRKPQPVRRRYAAH